MMVHMMKSKLHHATVTEAELHYVGSITIDEDLMDAANLIDHEKVQVLGMETGERLETYVIRGKRGSGVICMNGPAARKIQKGDTVLVISYAMMEVEKARKYKPVIVLVDENNKAIKKL